MAMTRPARSRSALVSPPGPGPISSTVSSGFAPTASAMRARILGSVKKCCPRRRLARGTLDPHDQKRPIVAGKPPEGFGFLQCRLDDRLGRFGSMAGNAVEQPGLPERLSGIVQRIDQ